MRDELEAIVSAGIPSFDALEMATADAARFVEVWRGGKASFGTIEVGKRADLILLSRNPLEDVSDIDQRIGVMVRGHWFSEDRLNDRLEEIAQSYGRQALR